MHVFIIIIIIIGTCFVYLNYNHQSYYEEMSDSQANIDIKRSNGKLVSMTLVMPIWGKIAADGLMQIAIPLFNMNTFAKNEADVGDAVRESLQLFCVNTEEFGNGIENELRLLGWDFISENDGITSMSFSPPSQNTIFNQVLGTGNEFREELELTC